MGATVRGADQQDRKSTAADLPHPPAPRSLLEPLQVMFWGSLVSASRKKQGRSENGLVWGSGVGGDPWFS